MAAGEKELQAGAVPDRLRRVRGVFDRGRRRRTTPSRTTPGTAWAWPTPSRRSSCRKATEVLVAGDVVTLEPGLYVDGVGGIRIEHNYLVTDTGYERLSNHTISLTT